MSGWDLHIFLRQNVYHAQQIVYIMCQMSCFAARFDSLSLHPSDLHLQHSHTFMFHSVRRLSLRTGCSDSSLSPPDRDSPELGFLWTLEGVV